MSHLLGEAVLAEVREDDRVLDMGTGNGVNAVLAAANAAEVVAVDINPYALDAARANAKRNGVADRIEVRHSDVFRSVEGEFDLIIFDPPFRWFAPRDLLEAAMTDEDYQAMTEFFRNARRHLRPDGRRLIFFGTSGDLAYLRRLADEEGFRSEVVACRDLVKDGWRVVDFTFRMTHPNRRMTYARPACPSVAARSAQVRSIASRAPKPSRASPVAASSDRRTVRRASTSRTRWRPATRTGRMQSPGE